MNKKIDILNFYIKIIHIYMIKTLAGDTYKNINIDYNNSYHYNDIKKLFSSLSQDKYFIITLNNNKISCKLI